MSAMLRVEARHSWVLRLSPLIAVILVGLMLVDRHQWAGVWPEASAALTSPLLFLAPVLAGLSSWEVRRRERGGKQLRSEAWVVPLLVVQLLAGGVVVLAGCVCAVAVNLGSSAPAGFLWPAYVVMALVAVSEAVAVGVLLGRLGGPVWFSPIVSTLLVFLRLVLTQGQVVGSPETRLARVFLAGHAWTGISAAATAVAVVEAVAVACLAVTLPRALRHLRAGRSRTAYPLSRQQRSCRVVGGVVLVAALVLVLVGPAVTYERPSPSDPLCTDTRMRVCVWPEDAARLPGLAELAARAQTEAELLGVSLPDHLSAYLAEPDSFDFIIESDQLWFAASSIAGVVAGAVVSYECIPPATDPQSEAYYRAFYELERFVELDLQGRTRPAGMGDTTGVDGEAVAKAWASDPQQRADWVAQRVERLREIARGRCG